MQQNLADTPSDQSTESPLAEWRRRKKKSMAAAAKEAGVAESTWCRYEQSLIKIPAEKVGILSELTGISKRKLRPDLF